MRRLHDGGLGEISYEVVIADTKPQKKVVEVANFTCLKTIMSSNFLKWFKGYLSVCVVGNLLDDSANNVFSRWSSFPGSSTVILNLLQKERPSCTRGLTWSLKEDHASW
ncbi:hypothetical protein AgCh_034278 [Apium graveolens]